ncbi:FAD/NAD-binding domain-containing protein [Fomitiporia mediterranea MF3/22]|uniref:FAD/NAD-binding domain-containing protein n=1 Tax=Fomitiporia mediterranea (strain MF3/22) TaxID=694068 RepID=UPI0004408762|nr:FAD/NAD-binding domain-containing protein [Fomitiporia mediterranea MF3/22]EJC99652.1 FAD/NAD-binding domain-containing protein [Fomitiporia mediterranea MF3/22]
MSATTVPTHTTVLVIGGGPGGSYTSTVLKREGFDVVLLEAVKFPRYHVGEGMLPSMRHYLRFIGLEEEFHNHGFMPKPGACFKLKQGMRETYTDFSTLGPSRTTWNVIRSESDEMMLRHAAREGVQVFEETRVDSIQFEGDPSNSRPISATWVNKNGASGEIKFDWLIDASGRNGIMETKYLKNRTFREGLRNTAIWGYWRNARIYQEGTKRSNSPWFEAMTDEQGWAWLIPLHDGTTSIGIVMHQDIAKKKKSEHPGGSPPLTEHYLEQLKLLPGVLDLLGEKGNLVPGSVKSSSDYSYHASCYSGDHYRIVGDAACFVDPFFSSGVHLAMTGALSAASTICASMKGQISEEAAQRWHDTKLGIAQMRFLLVVLSAYKQIRQQNKPVLGDVNEDNFDKAFTLFRPIILGTADSEAEHLSDSSLNSMIDFCVHLFDPTNEEQHKAAAKKYGPELVALNGPIMGSKEFDKVVDAADNDAKMVLSRMNALKVLRNDTSCESFRTDAVNGYVVELDRGNLGLVQA